MRKALAVLLVFSAAPAVVRAAPEGAELRARQAQVFAGEAGTPLAGDLGGPRRTAAGYLAMQGRDAATLRSLVVTSESAPDVGGVVHLRLEQRVGGLRVYGAYAKAAFDASGNLVHLIDGLAPVPAASLRSPTVDSVSALGSALRSLYPGFETHLRSVGDDGETATFDGGGFFSRNPRVTRVAIPEGDGSLTAGYLVETWKRQGNVLYHTVVGGDGRVVSQELRTNTDSYNIFPEDPGKGPQQLVAGPGAGNLESPTGWVFTGSQGSVNISGNNVHAYLDANSDNAPDAGGTTISDGNFVAVADLAQSPSTAANRAVAVQNLFYLNNVIHDRLYGYGFVESEGNFQANNFGNGGLGGDSVNAEAQDGSGTDNANFSTPSDGSSPRMQMYLWSPAGGSHELAVSAPAGLAGTYAAGGADFGSALDATGVTGVVVQALDGRGTATDACERISNSSTLSGKIALVDRGTCDFVKKALNVQNAGAIAMLVANNQGDDVFTMGGSNSRVTIPSEIVGQNTGDAIKAFLGAGVSATLRTLTPAPPMIDGDVDSDIVFHEYGHGLTWRMIGGMSGVMSGAIGEGMSDVLSILINGDSVVGEYAYSSAAGIRRYPYAGYPLTYGDFSGAEVHDDGEIYAAIGWRLGEIYQTHSLSVDQLLTDMVQGMKYTPSGPAFEDMRDGILQAVSGTGRECLVWQGFAQFGVGVGARASVRGTRVKVTESFALPPGC